LVKARLAPEGEWVLNPEAGEVVFLAHFACGFGLPASDFLIDPFKFFDLRLHHLVTNAMVQLAHHTACCESFLGVRLDIGSFLKFFNFRSQTVHKDGPLVDAGCAAIYPRGTCPMPHLNLPDTVKLGQHSYFFMRNATDVDWIWLSPFANVVSSRQAWSVKGWEAQANIDKMALLLWTLVHEKGLTAKDITLSCIAGHTRCAICRGPWIRPGPLGPAVRSPLRLARHDLEGGS